MLAFLLHANKIILSLTNPSHMWASPLTTCVHTTYNIYCWVNPTLIDLNPQDQCLLNEVNTGFSVDWSTTLGLVPMFFRVSGVANANPLGR